MKILGRVLLFHFSFFLFSCGQNEIDWQLLSGLESHFQDEINRYREENGLNPLAFSPVSHEQAKRYAFYLSDNEQFFYQVVRDNEVIQRYYTNIRTEIPVFSIDGCAAFSADALDPGGTAYLTLINDPNCRDKILSNAFTHIGVGAIQGESGAHYFAVFLISSTETE